MSFSEKYTVTKLAKSAPKAAPRPPTREERLRKKMQEALSVQAEALAAQIAGAEPPAATKKRGFWSKAPGGIAFTPMFENEWIFDRGAGVVVRSLDALADLMKDFSAAIDAGEFDVRLVEIADLRRARAAKLGATPPIDLPPGLADVD